MILYQKRYCEKKVGVNYWDILGKPIVTNYLLYTKRPNGMVYCDRSNCDRMILLPPKNIPMIFQPASQLPG